MNDYLLFLKANKSNNNNLLLTFTKSEIEEKKNSIKRELRLYVVLYAVSELLIIESEKFKRFKIKKNWEIILLKNENQFQELVKNRMNELEEKINE